MLDDVETAPVDERLRATLRFLARVTLRPTEADAAELRAAGVPDAAATEALAVCFLFNLIDRVADSLGFVVPPDDVLARGGHVLLAEGYGAELREREAV